LYGNTIFSATSINFSMSFSSSHFAPSSSSGPVATLLLGPIEAVLISPDARANRYDGMGTSCSNWYSVWPWPAPSVAFRMPLATTGNVEVILKEYVDLTSGVS
jgi:hypothetical protein